MSEGMRGSLGRDIRVLQTDDDLDEPSSRRRPRVSCFRRSLRPPPHMPLGNIAHAQMTASAVLERWLGAGDVLFDTTDQQP
jgi:hypothetical protein